MAYTETNLVNEIAAELFSLGTGQSPATEDAARITLRLPGILSELSTLNIIYIADTESVPDQAFAAVVSYCAAVLAPSFNLPPREGERIAAEMRLRALQRIGKGDGGTLRVDTGLNPRRRTSLF